MFQLSGRSFKLSKGELLRGYDAYKRIFRLSEVIESEYIRFNYIISKSDESPHNELKVGFSVSKKYMKRAVSRNRIKRMLKEIYRLNKNEKTLEILRKLSFLIISVKEKHLINNPLLLKSGFKKLNMDYLLLIEKMKKIVTEI